MEELITTSKTVSELIKDFESGDLAIPEIQRDVVWDHEQIKKLIHSITQGYPCGSFIYWEPQEKDKYAVESMIRPQRLEQYKGRLPRYFLLDGQQRVTALASVMVCREKLREILSEVEEDLPYIFADLRKLSRTFVPESTFETKTDLIGPKYPWVLLNSIFNGSTQTGAEPTQISIQDREVASRYTQRIRDYKFPVQIIKGTTYTTVSEIFTRINSQGTQLTGAEIYLARIVPHWRGITKEFKNYRSDLRDKNYDLDLTFLMRAISAIECDEARIKTLANKVEKMAEKGLDTRRHLNKSWKKVKVATDKLIRLLRNYLLLDRTKYFTSKNVLVPLVYYLARDKSRRIAFKDVQRFFILSQLGSHYSSDTESALRKDFRNMAGRSPRVGLQYLVKDVNHDTRQYYRGLKIKEKDVHGPGSKNVLLLLAYILMRKRGAKDWGSGHTKPLNEIDPKDMHLHHIFPFNFMIKSKEAYEPYKEREDFSEADFRAEINDIANLTFISSSKNSEIGDTPPRLYLPNETTREARKAHFIPEDPELWKPENFYKFMNERRKLLSKAMTTLIKRV